MTGTTNVAARMIGTGPFLPALFAKRYALMGGIDEDELRGQMRRLGSFAERDWCSYWSAIADDQLREAEHALASLGRSDIGSWLTDAAAADSVHRALKPFPELATALADNGPQPCAQDLVDLVVKPRGGSSTRRLHAAVVVDSLVKAMTYFQISAFPGGSPLRMEAYAQSRTIFKLLIGWLAPAVGVVVERLDIGEPEGEAVDPFVLRPAAAVGRLPAVLVTNGLEGTVQELAIPMLRHRNNGVATVLMEMPGTYVYEAPLSVDSQAVYDTVIDVMRDHPQIDPERIAIFGISFGGHWAARIAATNPHIRCAVANGAPADRSFGISGSIGVPQVIVDCLLDLFDASNPLALLKRTQELSLRELREQITVPLLVINGSEDTLISTQDSIDLATHAADATLQLYPGDDHCAIANFDDWQELAQQWIVKRLGATRVANG